MPPDNPPQALPHKALGNFRRCATALADDFLQGFGAHRIPGNVRNLAAVLHNDNPVSDAMNLEDIVSNINHEQPLLLQLHSQLIDTSPFAHREMIGRFVHDNNAIAESNCPGDFKRLLFAP